MEGSAGYAAVVEEALEKKQTHLNEVVLPAMRDNFRLFLTTFEGPYNILLKKGLIREDPYKLEDRISEIKLPARERFPPTDLDEQMGIRLSQYHSQVDFVINYYEFSTSFLTLQRLKQVTALVKYLDFSNLVETSASVNTGGLAVLLERVTKGSDSVAVGIVKNGVAHLAELSRRLLKSIADAVLYQRERYKLDLRTTAIPRSGLDPARMADRAGALAAVKRGAQAAGMPFYQDLVGEVLDEDYPADPAAGEELRAKVLSRLRVEEKKADKPKAAGPAPRDLLLDAVRSIAGTEAALRSALKTIRDNEELAGRKPPTLGERIRRFLARAAGAKIEERTYEIEYMDEGRGDTKSERLAFDAFVAEVTAKAKTLQALATKNSPALQKVQAASGDQIFDMLTKLGSELTRITKRMEGLSALFRSQVVPMHRSQFHGIHGDLALIRSGVGKANRQKHEYVARREEEEQFRKLGIAPKA